MVDVTGYCYRASVACFLVAVFVNRKVSEDVYYGRDIVTHFCATKTKEMTLTFLNSVDLFELKNG